MGVRVPLVPDVSDAQETFSAEQDVEATMIEPPQQDPNPILSSQSQQENSLLHTEGNIQIGFTIAVDGMNGVPTYTYLSTTGEAQQGGVRTVFGPCFQAGDVIGCGVEATTSQIFFTRNGEYLGAPFQSIPEDIVTVLHPTIVMDSQDTECTGNFGSDPFCYDPLTLLGTHAEAHAELAESWESSPSGEGSMRPGEMPNLPMKPQLEAYILPGGVSHHTGPYEQGQLPVWWNRTVLPLASPRSVPMSGEDIELQNLNHADVDHVMLQEVLTFTRAVISLRTDSATTNLRQFVALGARILRRCSVAVCVVMDDGTRHALLVLNQRITVLVAAVEAKLVALDTGNQILLALGEGASPESHDAAILEATEVLTSPESLKSVMSLVAENSDMGAGWVDDRRPIISLVASAVLGLLALQEDRSLAGDVGWYGLRPLVGMSFDLEDAANLAKPASAALALMAAHAADTKRFVKDGALQVIIGLLLPEDPVVRRLGATALARLSSKPENKVLIVQEGALKPLLQLCGSLNDIGLLQLLVLILSNLMDIPENLDKLIEHGGLEIVIDLLLQNENDIRCRAAKILSQFVAVPDFKRKIAETEALSRLVPCLSPSPNGDTELYAVTVISKIAAEAGMEFKAKIVESGGLQPLLCLAYPMVTRGQSSLSVVSNKPRAPPFPQRHKRSASESGFSGLLDAAGGDTSRSQTKRSAMLALRHIALCEEFHAAIIQCPAFKFVLHAFSDCDSKTVLEAVRLARQCTTQEEIGPYLCETDSALKALVSLANSGEGDVSAPALDILANLTLCGADLLANRIAVCNAGVIATMAAQNVSATQRFAVVQITANLFETVETRMIAVEQGGLRLLMDSVIDAEPQAAVDRFFTMRDINAEVGRGLLSLAEERSLWEPVLTQALPWLLKSLDHPESDHQHMMTVQTMAAVGLDFPEEMLRLKDPAAVLNYWKLSTDLRARASTSSDSTVFLPPRHYWTFNSFGPVLGLIIEKFNVDAIQFTDSQFGGHFSTEFQELLSKLVGITSIKFKWTESIETVAEDDILVVFAQLPRHVCSVSLDGPLSAGALKKFCSMLRSKPLIKNISLQNNELNGGEIGPLLGMLRERELQELELVGNSVGDRGCQELCEVVAEVAHSLRKLGLGRNGIGKASLDAIANMITRAPRLISLDLSGNSLGRQDLSLVRGGSMLSCLSPSHMGKSRDVMESIGELRIAVYTSTSLCELKLQKNGVLNSQDELSIEERLAQNKAIMIANEGLDAQLLDDSDTEDLSQVTGLRRNHSDGSLGSMTSGASFMSRESTESLSSSPKPPSYTSHTPQGAAGATHEPPPYAKEPTIMILFAAPLAYTSGSGMLQGLELLDYEQERELLYHTVNETGAAIDVQFKFATTDTFRSVVTVGGCRVLHYSGHGSKQFLGMEDGRAGMHKVDVEALRELFAAGGASDIQLVFVSACRSRNAAEAFISVGVPHVVAVEAESQVTDVAARAFTRAFYLALAKGKSVQGSFDIARQAVSTSPQVPSGIIEAAKFVLIGHEDHSLAIFDDVGACGPRPIPLLANDILPVTPEGFHGRSLAMYEAVHSCLDRRLVTIIGEPGIGKTALAIASANYISERRTGCFQGKFGDGVHFVDASDMTSVLELQNVLSLILLQEKEAPLSDLLLATRTLRALVVIVNWSSLLKAPLASKPSVEDIVKVLLTQTRGVRLLVTSGDSLSNYGIRLEGVAEKVVHLNPLSNEDAARVFFRRAPRRITPVEMGVSSPMDVIRALARHPLVVDFIQGHPGRIVDAVALLDGTTTIGELFRILSLRQSEAQTAPTSAARAEFLSRR